MRKRTLVIAAVVAAVPVVAWGIVSLGDNDPERTATALREDFRLTVEATGTLEAAVFYEIGPPSLRDFWQYNLTWMIPEGSTVKQGDVIARFDAQQLDDRLRDHRAELETATQQKEKEERDLEVQLRQLRLDLVQSRADIEKVSLDNSVPSDLLPEIEREQNRLKEDLARKNTAFLEEKITFQQDLVQNKLDLLEVKKSRAQQRIDYYETAKAKFEVKAPTDGVVIYIPKRNGDRWEVGEAVWMLAKIMKVADVDTLRVEAQVLEVDAARIAVSQASQVTVDALPGKVIESRVDEIGRIVHERSPQDPSKVFDVYLPLDEIDPETMRPGMSIRVNIEVEEIPDQITIPMEAVQVNGKGPMVLVAGRSGVSRRPVVLGARNGERVVVESGLEEGEQILLDHPADNHGETS
jgi:HlyD family secretion protein